MRALWESEDPVCERDIPNRVGSPTKHWVVQIILLIFINFGKRYFCNGKDGRGGAINCNKASKNKTE